MLKYFICSTFLGSWVRVKWVTNVEGGRRGDKRLKMGMQRRGEDGIVVQLSSLHWPQINTYAMHKILVTTGYWNDNADNCLNVLQPSAREMIKMTSKGNGLGEVGAEDDEDICLLCVRAYWMTNGSNDPMQCKTLRFISSTTELVNVGSRARWWQDRMTKTEQNRKRTTGRTWTSNTREEVGEGEGGENTPQPKQFPTKFLWKLVSLLITSLFVCKLE